MWVRNKYVYINFHYSPTKLSSTKHTELQYICINFAIYIRLSTVYTIEQTMGAFATNFGYYRHAVKELVRMCVRFNIGH